MLKINPFQPNNPVSVEMFAGRTGEIGRLVRGLHQTRHDMPANFLITGEIGIGKSSLMMLMEHMASGHSSTPDGQGYRFVPISCRVSETMGLMTLVNLIEANLKRELYRVEKLRGWLDKTWEFVQRVKLMNSSVESSQREENVDLLIDQFSYSLAQTCNRLVNPEQGEDKKDGMVFFIDEADNARSDLHLGLFLKLVTEQLQSHNCNNIMFIVAGLPEVADKLSVSHPSSLRIFTPINVTELSLDDRVLVVERGMRKGNETNEEKITISGGAVDMISKLSEGYPHYIQQFAHSAYEKNVNGEISFEDVFRGAFDDGGALDIIGQRYYKNFYDGKIQSDEYREVLSIMAENMNAWIKKSDIRQKFSGNESTLTNALSAMTQRKIILKKQSTRGEYRLQQQGFALWIKLFGQREKENGKRRGHKK